ncbi:MAG: type II toxin-antitoxin system VapC family toxin [Bifidobacteriaceae bacterium]|jgi:predicted nucleic acid-binding protein|nr:type II toxin-antitoxin system VapC family toxin [Bifidobacteriaceae bacterium]
MALVVDASVACAWLLEDEKDELADSLGDQVASSGAVVPSLFWAEVTNVLVQAHRRGRISRADASASLQRLSRMALSAATHRAPPATLAELAFKHSLTAYDAVYLDLALALGAELATLDAELIAAARAEGVTVLP